MIWGNKNSARKNSEASTNEKKVTETIIVKLIFGRPRELQSDGRCVKVGITERCA